MRALLTLIWTVCVFAAIFAALVMCYSMLDFDRDRFLASIFSMGVFLVPVIWLRDDV